MQGVHVLGYFLAQKVIPRVTGTGQLFAEIFNNPNQFHFQGEVAFKVANTVARVLPLIQWSDMKFNAKLFALACLMVPPTPGLPTIDLIPFLLDAHRESLYENMDQPDIKHFRALQSEYLPIVLAQNLLLLHAVAERCQKAEGEPNYASVLSMIDPARISDLANKLPRPLLPNYMAHVLGALRWDPVSGSGVLAAVLRPMMNKASLGHLASTLKRSLTPFNKSIAIVWFRAFGPMVNFSLISDDASVVACELVNLVLKEVYLAVMCI